MNYNNLFTSFTSISETESSLRVNDIPLTLKVYNFVKKISSLFAPLQLFHFSIITDFGDEIDLNSPFDDSIVSSSVTIKINKSNSSQAIYFFTSKAFDYYVTNSSSLARNIVLIFKDEGFSTIGINFHGRNALWNKCLLKTNLVNKSEPIKLVKPLNDNALKLLPEDLNDWIIESSRLSVLIDSLPKKWIVISFLKCCVSVSSEYFLSDNQIHIFFNNPNRTEVKLSNSVSFIDSDAFLTLQKIVQWIYIEGQDTETKYTLFNSQIGLIENSELKLIEGFPEKIGQTFDTVYRNAKLAYTFHLSKVGKELHKSLIELNKNLIDNLQKIRQNASDLISGLWRDFTTVFGLLLLNFAIKKPDLGRFYWNMAFTALVLYLIISFALTSSTSFWFLNKLKEGLIGLRSNVYSYLTEEDFNKYASKPLKNALKRYRLIFWVVLVSYLGIIVAVYCAYILDISIQDKKTLLFIKSS